MVAVLTFAMCSLPVTTYAESNFTAKKGVARQATFNCEFMCQLDAASCDRNAEGPAEHRACANENRRCLARCNNRAALRGARHR
jgi:hypothetical protein